MVTIGYESIQKWTKGQPYQRSTLELQYHTPLRIYHISFFFWMGEEEVGMSRVSLTDDARFDDLAEVLGPEGRHRAS